MHAYMRDRVSVRRQDRLGTPSLHNAPHKSLAQSDLSTHVLIGGSGHSSIAEAAAPGDSDESSWASDNYNGGRDDTSSSDSDGRVQSNKLGSKTYNSTSGPFKPYETTSYNQPVDPVVSKPSPTASPRKGYSPTSTQAGPDSYLFPDSLGFLR